MDATGFMEVSTISLWGCPPQKQSLQRSATGPGSNPHIGSHARPSSVWAVNSAGKAPSSWTRCRTGPAPPEGLRAPTFHAVSSTQAVVNISVPGKPNGNVSLYRLFSNTSGAHTVLSEGLATQQTLRDLRPFTTYSIGVEACTCFDCCSKGPTAELRTHPAPPSGVSSPQVQTLASRTASFQWSPPLFPNGVIQSYELHLHVTCPPESALPCTPSQTEVKYSGPGQRASLEGLQPYTTYKLRVVAHNEAGGTASQWISFTTQKECLVLTTPGEKKGSGSKSAEFYSELWFIVLMAMLGLILLAIFLSLILQRKIHREPYIRERPPLVPLQKRMSPLSVYPPGDTHMVKGTCTTHSPSSHLTHSAFSAAVTFSHASLPSDQGLADTKIPQSGTPVSIRSSRSVSVLRIPSQSQVSQTYSQGSLHRSVSQLMDMQDKKVLVDDALWETIMGHSSRLYVDEEDLMNAIKGFSSVTKEHTTFTDTHL
ncbi:Hypothetical predicted protein [Marmota monax]|uniref:Fibronectin type-III domain-containing protein n=1 Tax=Marmota monax TaxID=9995 RepID=A0A5E4BL11_MARMO|nr:hypothetical protein GHT09_005793 [Marmota monax]VTJ70085.1 Hypothetical predicted protein [Marmota monax]